MSIGPSQNSNMFRLGKSQQYINTENLKSGTKVTKGGNESVFLKKLDTNNNGIIDKSEYDNFMAKLNNFIADDHKLSKKEAKALIKQYAPSSNLKAQDLFEALGFAEKQGKDILFCEYDSNGNVSSIGYNSKEIENGKKISVQEQFDEKGNKINTFMSTGTTMVEYDGQGKFKAGAYMYKSEIYDSVYNGEDKVNYNKNKNGNIEISIHSGWGGRTAGFSIDTLCTALHITDARDKKAIMKANNQNNSHVSSLVNEQDKLVIPRSVARKIKEADLKNLTEALKTEQNRLNEDNFKMFEKYINMED